MLHVAFGFYLLNLAVGLSAQFAGLRFGRAHHGLYAVVTITAILALIDTRAPALWVPVAALAAFPRARPRTAWHPLLALVGRTGYLATYFQT